jgi:tetratricopeptide (TPR) repeat protein
MELRGPTVRRWSAALLAALASFLPAHGAAFDAVLLEKENEVSAQKQGSSWRAAEVGLKLVIRDKVRTGAVSRAVLGLTDRTMMRLDERTVAEIALSSVKLNEGGIYFFSRERAPEIQIVMPAANGTSRGTQFVARVTPAGKTLLAVFEGEVELSNPLGILVLRSGEQGEAEFGKPPRPTAGIEATNLLQWALYYPAVLDPGELGLDAADQRAVVASLAAYRDGDLLGALEQYPKAYRPNSTAGKLYRAAVILAVGQVDEARRALAGVPANAPGRLAIEQMIAAVNFEDWQRQGADKASAGEWIAESYYLQSKSDLEGALGAARRAAELSPQFGYAWTRIAELEFSFGRTRQALQALGHGLNLAPRNAQAHALRGFLLSAQNSITAAREAFDEAIRLDGALGNGWLGRGLTYIRQGRDEQGRQDLQVATTVEPKRSILHAYLGKAFSQVGDTVSARRDLLRARELDSRDPMPWLYFAIQNKQENRYNAAVAALEESLRLNENRRVYRSQFLLDQDRAMRGTNLAAIYLNNGMRDVSVREAIRAVDSDYASASAHLFLSNSFDALRDPRRILLRNETAWFNELLLSNLLSPVGGGSLSQYVSQQEYSKLFEADGLGINSVTDYFSYGELRQTGSQYGTFGNISYALDAEYQYNNGRRPNNEISRFESYATFKLQLTPQDTVFLKAKYQDLRTGDLFQRYNDDEISRNTPALTFDYRERQDPGLLLLGYHHEWNPGIHTLALFGRLASDQAVTADQTRQLLLQREIGSIAPAQGGSNLFDTLREFRGRGDVRRVFNLDLDFDYRSNFEIYSGELNQIITLGPQTFVLGSRYQKGYFETHHLFDGLSVADQNTGLFLDPPAKQDFTVDFERVNLYAYDIWRIAPWLSITGGVTYDKLRYPENYRTPPISDDERSFTQTSPKAGFILTPHPTLVVRGAYTEAISGASFDESVRLEPTQVAGFNQAYRTIISEDIAGSLAGATYKTWGLSLEQKLPTRTYWGVEYNVLTQDLDRTVGVFDLFSSDPFFLAVLPSEVKQKLVYREDVLTATVNQLIGDRWSFGSRYRYSKAKLREHFGEIPNALFASADTTRSSVLHEVALFGLYNHPSGFFARGEARWFSQENDGFQRDPQAPHDDPRPGDDFWQLNAFAGYRFYRNQCEVSCGVLNITDTDYHLEPLNYYLELPRERTFFVRVKLTF